MLQKMACPHVLCFEEYQLHDEDDSRKGYEEVSEGSKLRMDVRCPFTKKKHREDYLFSSNGRVKIKLQPKPNGI